jgi:hypothetical protein
MQRYEVQRIDSLDETFDPGFAGEFQASDEFDAAEIAAADSDDSEDYDNLSNVGWLYLVRTPDKRILTVRVFGEAVMEYNAYREENKVG